MKSAKRGDERIKETPEGLFKRRFISKVTRIFVSFVENNRSKYCCQKHRLLWNGNFVNRITDG
jgi:hypothetical protein